MPAAYVDCDGSVSAGKRAAAAKLPWDKLVRVCLVALFSAVGSFLFGLDIGYIGPIVECGSFKRDVANISDPAKSIPSAEEGMIVSLFSIGAIVTSCPLISSYFLDTWGRKYSIMLGGFIFTIGSALQATAACMTQMLVGRFVAGMSIGLLSSVIVLYQSELAPASLRGTLSTLYQLMIAFGILAAAVIDQFLVEREDGWRTAIWIMSIPAVVLVVGMLFMPQSPRWLVQQGRVEEAIDVLLTIRSEEEAHQEAQEIFDDLQRSAIDGEAHWAELFQGRVGRLLCLGVLLQLLQQLVGMNAFMYFGPTIFVRIGFNKYLFTTITNLVNFLATFPAVVLADVAGRRSLMVWSSVGMATACVIMGGLGTAFVTDDSEGGWTVANPTAGKAIAGSIFFFVANFAYGFGPIVWVYVAEIFPTKYRARAVGICTMANWVGNFAIAQFTPMLIDGIRFSTFFVFGGFCLIGVLVALWLPETKGVPLELVGQLFDNKPYFPRTAKKANHGEAEFWLLPSG